PGKGSGMGLSMIYGYAKQSRGHVKIYSEPGRGTTVRLYLPVAAGEVGRDAGAPAAAAAPARGGERILVVEDDRGVRAVATMQLRNLGYHVLEAENAEAALAVLHDDATVDLLFTDIVMPGDMTGDDLAKVAQA